MMMIHSTLQIAEDVVELKEAFTDLNTLVEEQGDMLTEIEDNTSKAVDQVKAGTKGIFPFSFYCQYPDP